MRMREELPATLSTPPRWERRMTTSEKVRQIVSPAEERTTEQPSPHERSAVRSAVDARRPKLTTRILPEQLTWIHSQLDRFREEFPRSPRLTVAELVQIAIEQLRESKNLDYLVTKFRS